MGNKLSQFINRASTSTNRTVTIKKDWSTENTHTETMSGVLIRNATSRI